MHPLGPIAPQLLTDAEAAAWVEQNCAGSVQGIKDEEGRVYWWFSNPEELEAVRERFDT